jgi:hypothetical protein
MDTGLNKDERPAEEQQEPAEAHLGLLRRQILFLRRTWWNTDPLTLWQRVALFLRGAFLIAVGFVGLITAVATTFGAQSGGMDSIAKLMAEYMLIPIALLAAIVVGFGGSLIVRSFVAPSPEGGA